MELEIHPGQILSEVSLRPSSWHLKNKILFRPIFLVPHLPLHISAILVIMSTNEIDRALRGRASSHHVSLFKSKVGSVPLCGYICGYITLTIWTFKTHNLSGLGSMLRNTKYTRKWRIELAGLCNEHSSLMQKNSQQKGSLSLCPSLGQHSSLQKPSYHLSGKVGKSPSSLPMLCYLGPYRTPPPEKRTDSWDFGDEQQNLFREFWGA